MTEAILGELLVQLAQLSEWMDAAGVAIELLEAVALLAIAVERHRQLLAEAREA